MTPSLITLGWANIIAAVTLVLISLPLILRRVKRNRFYGIRIPIAFKSDQHWEDINAYGGKTIAFWSLPILIAGLYALFVAAHNPSLIPSQSLQYWLLTFASAIAMILATIQILVWSQTLGEKQ